MANNVIRFRSKDPVRSRIRRAASSPFQSLFYASLTFNIILVILMVFKRG